MKKMFTILQTHVSRIVAVVTIAVMGLSPQLADAQSTSPAPYCSANFPNSSGPCTGNIYGFGISRFRLANLDYWEPVCNAAVTGNYRFFTPPAADRALLSPGNTYQIRVKGIVGNQQSMYMGVWVDWDKNTVFDASEYLTVAPAGGQVSGTEWTTNLTIPCGATPGTYRIRAVTSYSTAISSASACMSGSYGETWDFEITVLPTPPLPKPDFTVPANVFIGTPMIIVNTTKINANFSWDLDLDGTDATSTDFPHVFTTSGTRFMKLKIQGCGVADSIIKAINVQNPTKVPGTDFYSSRTKVEEYDEIILTDISTDGPSAWDWAIEDPLDPNNNNGYNQYNANAIATLGLGGRENKMLFMMEGMGYFDVTLTATNGVGNKSRKKASYIEVVPFSEFRLGNGPRDTELGKGTIYDKYGPNALYLNGPNGDPSDNVLRIRPCGALKITLRVERFKFATSTHNLKVWDGPNAAFGKPLHPAGGFTKDNVTVPFEIVATSGQMYMELDTKSAGQDSGLIAYFETDFGVTGPPSPSIGLGGGLAVAYTQAITEVKSTSQNIFGNPTYSWFVDGSPVSGSNLIGEGEAFNHTFPTAGTYQVCMELTSCAGDASFCDDITVVDPTGQTDLDFIANDIRPDAFQPLIVSSTSDKANRFVWEIDPPGKFNFQFPFNENSKDLRGAFSEAGSYTITLTAFSTFDSALTSRTVTKQDYIVVVDYCTPGVQIVSGDIGLRNIRINNNSNETVFSQTTTTGLVGYEPFVGESADRISLYVGGTYNITLSRASNSDAASHAVFIDYNGNGMFETSERVLRVMNTTSSTTAGSFKVPNIEDVFTGFPVRMRVVTSFKGNEPTACGPLTVGEFEDYLVDIKTITDAPVITIYGSGEMSIEQGQKFEDPGAFAWDVLEGDISNLIMIESDVDSSTIGTYTIKYTVRNASGLEATPRTRIVHVNPDNTPAVLTLLGLANDTIEVFSVYNDLGVTAIDAVDGDITADVVVNSNLDEDVLGDYQIVYTITDAANNTTSVTRNVVVVDTEAPEIIVIGTTQIELGSFWYDQTSVSDNYWSVNQITFTKEYGFSGPVRWDVKGNYTVTYTAIDGSGNKTVLTRNYVVDDFTAPVVKLNTSDTVIHDVATNYTPKDPEITDNNYPANTLQVEHTTNLNVNQIGLYSETYRATDGSGNTTTRVRYIRVIDRYAPVITAPTVCSKVGFDFNSLNTISVSDNYYPSNELMALVEVKSSNVNPYFVGDYAAIYQVTDPSGNTSVAVTQQIKISETCELVTSVNDVNVSNLVKVYPNPSSGLFNVDISKLAGTSNNIRVMDNIGNEVMTIDLSTVVEGNFVLDLSNFASGVYMLNIQGAEHNVVVRLVVVK